ncbi:MAG TPA: rhomboid family intramembrane serine protease [Flavobacterium sp.]|jgi:membrane associated rhomboid family serine protease
MNDDFKFSPSVILLPFFSVLLLWVIFWAEVKFHFNFAQYGIYPRTPEGLRGIVLSPFIHGNLEHLYNNSIPLLILVAALRYFYREQSMKVLGYGILLSGFLTWVIGRESHHIGASGLIYVLVSFIFIKGIMTKYYRLVALSLTIIMIYGGMVWYVFPDVEVGISWEGHLAGLITGFAFAVVFKTPEYQKLIKYEWEQPDYNPEGDKFLERFDENGNFVNKPKPEPEEEDNSSLEYHYHFVPKEKPQEGI